LALPSRRRRWRWVLVVLAMTLTTAVAWHYGGWSWGSPSYREDFGKGLQMRWRIYQNSFSHSGDRFESLGAFEAFAVLRRHCSGPAAIEFDASFAPLSQPGDLSVIWLRQNPNDATFSNGLFYGKPAYLLQVGANDNQWAQIIDTEAGIDVAKRPFRLSHEQTHHVRAEITAKRLALWVDGELVCEYATELPLTGGWLGIFGYYPGKRFSNVRIWDLGPDRDVDGMGRADALLQAKAFAAAALHYADLEAARPEGDARQEARYKRGLCAWLDGKREEAQTCWRTLLPGHWSRRAALREAGASLAAGEVAATMAALQAVAAADDSRLSSEIAQLWRQYAAAARASGQSTLIETALSFQAQWLAERAQTWDDAAGMLIAQGRSDEAIARFPPWLVQVGNELMRRGDYEPLLAPGDELQRRSRALLQCGRFTELLAMPHCVPTARFTALASLGREDEAFASLRELDARLTPWLLGSLGRWEEAWALPFPADADGETAAWRTRSAYALGKDDEVLALWRAGRINEDLALPAIIHAGLLPELDARRGNNVASLQWERCCTAIQASLRGDPAAAAELWRQAGAKPLDHGLSPAWSAILLARPLLAARGGDRTALDQALATIEGDYRWSFAQRAWHLAAFARGSIGEQAFLDQPLRREAPGLLNAARAIKAERDGDAVAAATAWRAWLAQERSTRLIDGLPDVALELLAQPLPVGAPAP